MLVVWTRVAFGNPNSIADVNGVPYIYASDEDSSFVDITRGNKRVSFALSEASLVNQDGSANITDCKIGVGFGDPQNPPCARLVLSGNISQPPLGSDEEIKAKAALFARHPSFKHFPKDHNFFVAKLNIDGIWLIDEYVVRPATVVRNSGRKVSRIGNRLDVLTHMCVRGGEEVAVHFYLHGHPYP